MRGEELTEGIWGETTKIRGHLRGSIKNNYSRNFLKYKHV